MSQPLAEASVKAVLDFADLDREFAARLDTATKNASNVVAKNLGGVTKAAQDTTTRVNKAFDSSATAIGRASTQARDASGRFVAASDAADETGRKLTGAARAGEIAGSTIGKAATGFLHLGDSALGAVGKLAKFSGLAGAVTGAVSGLASGFGVLTLGFGRLQSIEQAEAKLVGLGHSAESVTGIMDSALASVKGTAFGLGDAATVAASAVAAGIKPGQDLTRTLKLIGDAATIGGTSMSDMGAIFNKVATSGKVQGEVLAQLGDRGIPIIQLLADEMGVAASEVADLGAEGKISFDTFRNAIEKGMGGAALSAGQTFSGAVDNAKAAMGRLGAEILKGPFNAAPNIIGMVTNGIDQLTNKVKGISELLTTGNYTSDIGKLLGVSEDSSVVDHILTIRDAVLQLYGGAKLLLSGDYTSDIGTMLGVSEDSPLVDRILTVRELFQGWGAQIGNIFTSLKDTALQLVDPIGRILGSLGEASGAIGVSVWSVLLTILEELAPILGGILVEGLSMVADLMERNQGIVTALVGAWTAYRGVLILVAAVQAVTNAVMAANPIGMIVIALAALAAGLVYAYKNSETFRNIVQGAWSAIQTAVSTAWEFIKGVFAAISDWVTGTLVPIFQSLWGVAQTVWGGIQNVISVAWGVIQGIFLALKIAFAIVATALLLSYETFIKPLWDNFVAGLQLVGDFFGWVWGALIEPAWNLLTAGLQAGYDLIIKPLWDNFVAGLQMVGNFFQWVWDNVIKPAWDLLTAGIQAGWDLIVMPVFNALKTGLQAVGDFFGWVWDNLIKPAWERFSSGLKNIYDTIIQPVFDAIGTALDVMGKAFDAAVRWVGQVWDKIKGIVAVPIKFVIEKVYNDGIREAWGKVAGWLGLDPLPEFRPDWLGQFARGGVMPGYTPGRDVHRFYSATGGRLDLSGGESVMRPEWTAAVGARGVDDMNRIARTRGTAGVRDYMTRQNLALGGTIDTSLWEAINRAFPGATLNSAYRPGDSGYHGRAAAVDIGGPMQQVADWVFATFPRIAQLIWGPGPLAYNVNGNYIGDQNQLRNSVYAADLPGHYDHVHVGSDFPVTYDGKMISDEGASTGGGVFGAVTRWLRRRVADVFDAIMTPIGAAIPTFGDTAVGRVPKAAFDLMRDKVREWLLGKADEHDPGTGQPATPGTGPVWDQIKEAFGTYGWGDGPQWAAAEWIVNKESGGNPHARNPTSGAYGIGQFLGHENDKYGAMGAYSDNPRQQATAMAEYIRDSYGDPLAAKAFWEANGWYDQGGMATGRGFIAKNTIQPERVLSPGLTEVFERFVDVLERFANGELPADQTPPAPTEPAPSTTSTGGKVYPRGIAGANAWAADQDFGKQAADWGTGAAQEILGQFTDPFGLKSVSDRAIEDLRTAAEALAAARQQQGANVTVNVNGAGNAQDVGAAVVDQIEERMAPANVRYRNGG